MDKLFPAIFKKENNNYVVIFPDIKSLIIKGKTLEDAYGKAKNNLKEFLDKDESSFEIIPSKLLEIIQKNKDEIVLYIEYNTLIHSNIDISKAMIDISDEDLQAMFPTNKIEYCGKVLK